MTLPNQPHQAPSHSSKHDGCQGPQGTLVDIYECRDPARTPSMHAQMNLPPTHSKRCTLTLESTVARFVYSILISSPAGQFQNALERMQNNLFKSWPSCFNSSASLSRSSLMEVPSLSPRHSRTSARRTTLSTTSPHLTILNPTELQRTWWRKWKSSPTVSRTPQRTKLIAENGYEPSWSNTPPCTLGHSPAELMYGRGLCNGVPQPSGEVKPTMTSRLVWRSQTNWNQVVSVGQRAAIQDETDQTSRWDQCGAFNFLRRRWSCNVKTDTGVPRVKVSKDIINTPLTVIASSNLTRGKLETDPSKPPLLCWTTRIRQQPNRFKPGQQ